MKLFSRSLSGAVCAGVVAIVVFTSPAHSDWLEVRKNTNVYDRPTASSAVVHSIEISDYSGPYLLHLVEPKKNKGFYRVQLKGRSETGWVASTMVRRQRDGSITIPPYNRTLYRHWIDEDGDCQDTRAEVLVRDADSPQLTFADDRHCVVTGGTWTDPYTGQVVHDAKALDVDHVVPLKNAHQSGAWAWSPQRKKAYANYLDDSQHLLAVSLSENRRKGDKGPDAYVPPLKSFRCTYIREWAHIKADWELEMAPAEAATVHTLLTHCP